MLFEGKDRREVEKLKKSEGLLPPGQSLTLKWPVLHYGSVPSFDPSRWDFRVYGLVEAPLALNWKEFNGLPKIKRTSDFHCVTRWSRFDNRWGGGRSLPGVAGSSASQARSGLCTRARRTGIHRECAFGGSGPGRSAAGHSPRRRAAERGARFSFAPDCSPSLCLEIGEVGARAGISRSRRARVLGTKRVSHVWRPVEGTEVRMKRTSDFRLPTSTLVVAQQRFFEV